MAFGTKDASLILTKALSNGAGNVVTDGIDTQNGPKGDFVAPVEFELEAPAMTTGILPDAGTMIYSVEQDTDPAFGTAEVLYPSICTQTGAGGAGATAKTVRFRLPSNVKRYVRVKATKSGTGNASTLSMTVSAKF